MVGGFALLLLSSCVPRRPAGQTRILYSFWGGREQVKIERDIAAAFERANPDVKVDVLPTTFARYAEKLQAMFVGDVAPDVLLVDITRYYDWASRGVLMDLTSEAVALEAANGEMMPLPKKAFTYRGRFDALPVNLPARVTFVNLDALAQAGVSIPAGGLTWSWLEENGPRLSRRAGAAKASTEYAIALPDPEPVLWGFGGKLFDNPERPTQVTVNSPETVQFFEFMRRLRVAPWCVPPDVQRDEGWVQLFRDGRVALFFGARQNMPEFADRAKFHWSILAAPAGPRRPAALHLGTGIAVSAKTHEPEAARRFARFYASAEGAGISMRAGRIVPVYRSLAYGPAFLSQRPVDSIRRLAETMEEGASEFPLYAPGSADVRKALRDRTDQAMVQPERPVKEIVKLLEIDLQRWLEKSRRKDPL